MYRPLSANALSARAKPGSRARRRGGLSVPHMQQARMIWMCWFSLCFLVADSIKFSMQIVWDFDTFLNVGGRVTNGRLGAFAHITSTESRPFDLTSLFELSYALTD